MIDSGLPVTTFAFDETKQTMRKQKLPVRSNIENEKYRDFNGRPLNLLHYVFGDLQVGDSYSKS